MPTSRSRPAGKRNGTAIDLALQGGGSHGAFTWGVLDRLLEDGSIEFDGVSGTSAGALNAAVLATGLARGGRDAARRALQDFWEGVAGSGTCFGTTPSAGAQEHNPWPWWPTPFGPVPSSSWLHDFHGWNPATRWLSEITRVASPYQFNPFDINPLRELVREHVQVEALRTGELSVFVNATSVHTGRPRIFRREDLTHDALLASACLPQLFRAVMIEGEPYWDGGYSGNPALWPLIYETAALDLVLVQINPLLRRGTPDTLHEINDRINEITFNAGLVSEMRAIAFVQKLHIEGRIDTGQYKNLRLHRVADEPAMQALDAQSKLDTGLEFLRELHGLGRAAADRWLAGDAKFLGKRSTLDVRRDFLGEAG